MDSRRVVLYALIACVSFLLWNAWQLDYPTIMHKNETTQATAVTHTHSLATVDHEAVKPVLPVTSSTPIDVQTDVLKLTIDLNQGDVVSAYLLNYPEQVGDAGPFQLLSDKVGQRYVANSALVSSVAQQYVNNQFNFKSLKAAYQLQPEQQTLVVNLEGKNAQGLHVIKSFTFKRGSYLIEVSYLIQNEGSEPWTGLVDMQLLRNEPATSSTGLFQIGTYTGASYSEPGVHRYQKVSFTEMQKRNLNIQTKGGWIAMQQHYFLTAWIPSAQQATSFYTREIQSHYTIGAMNDLIQVKPGQQVQTKVQLFLGPELTSVLKSIAPGLDLTVDYGWFWFISEGLFSVMKIIEKVLGNWGWAIIAITVLIKLMFYQLSAKSYHSMAGMRQLQPKLEALKSRYGDDKAKLSQATMELYREEKINPLGGCLPIVIQIPVFIALYWVLVESVELRQAPFIAWITDLAAPDAYHVLPIIMGLTMLVQQRLNPTPPDPIQEKMMLFLPVLFTGLFWGFPSGLVLYWIVNNILSIMQQWWITKRFEAAPKRIKAKKG